MKTGLVLGILLAALPAAAFAADALATVPEPLHKDILQLIRLTQATNMAQLVGSAVAQQLINNLKAAHPEVPAKAFTIIEVETQKTFGSAATLDKLTSTLVPIFAKYYTDADVRGMIAFYKTPLGQKVIATNPKIAQAGLQAGESLGRELAPQLVANIKARFKQEGIKLDESKGGSPPPPPRP